MYSTSEFLEHYKTLEKWAVIKYGDEGVKDLEASLYDRRTRNEVRYFRILRNLLSHEPNDASNPLIVLTDELKMRFETPKCFFDLT